MQGGGGGEVRFCEKQFRGLDLLYIYVSFQLTCASHVQYQVPENVLF